MNTPGLFQKIVAALPQVVFLRDLRGSVLYVNPAAERVVGRTLHEARGQFCWTLFGDRRCCSGEHCPLTSAVDNASPSPSFERRTDPPSGNQRDILCRCATLADEPGNTCYLVIWEDVTEHLRAGATTQLLAAAVEQSAEGVALVDLEENLLFTNNAFADLHGYGPEELVGQHLSIFHRPDQLPAVEAANRQVQEAGVFGGEIWHARRDGTVFPAYMQNTLLRDEAGRAIGMIATLHDISEQKEAEAQRNKLQAQVRHAQKLESLGLLTGGIAHDFNNLLTGILGTADLALFDIEPSSPTRCAAIDSPSSELGSMGHPS